jgi:hypothetical protein
MKRILMLAGCLPLLVALSGAGPSAGFMKHAAKGFSTNAVSDVVDKDGKLQTHAEMMMYMLGHKSRMDIDASKMTRGDGKKDKDGDAFSGMGKMYILGDGQTKMGYMVFPDAKLYIEAKAGQKNKSQAPKTDWLQSEYSFEDQGAETIDGHPCRKVKATRIAQAASAEGEDSESADKKNQTEFFWLAKDLGEFPVQHQVVDNDEEQTTTMTFKNITFGHVDPKLLELPADFKKGSFMDLMKSAMKSPRKQADDGDKGEKADEDKKDDDSGKDADKSKDDDKSKDKKKSGLGGMLKKFKP